MDTIAILGFGATLVFGVLGLFLYFRSKRHKRLTFSFDQTELHTRTHPEIRITFRNRPVNLSRLRAVCWNSGTEEIRWADVPEIAPPKVVFSGARVLSVAHMGATGDTAFVAEQRDDNSVSVKFAFLNPDDCGFFEVLYERAEPEKTCVQFVARIIGGRPTDSRSFTGPLTAFESIASIALPLAWVLAAYLSAGPVRRSVSRVPDGFQITIGGAALVLLLLLVLGACLLVVRRYMNRLRQSRVPGLAKEFLSGRSNKALHPTAPVGRG
jgi:uncharacterized protein (DUF58 family)